MKTPGYMNYNKYKKTKENSSQKAIIIFISTFFIMLLLFTAIAKHLSPEVDVAIGDNVNVEAKETGLGVKGFIDDRLKMIQMEDNMAGASKNMPKEKNISENTEDENYSPELDEKVRLPKHITDKKDTEKKVAAANSTANIEKDLTPIVTTTSKVVVGYYTTMEQAKVAQGILIDSGLGGTPFVKDMGGSYTIQVGSFSSHSKAQSVANELLRNNFPARVIQE